MISGAAQNFVQPLSILTKGVERILELSLQDALSKLSLRFLQVIASLFSLSFNLQIKVRTVKEGSHFPLGLMECFLDLHHLVPESFVLLIEVERAEIWLVKTKLSGNVLDGSFTKHSFWLDLVDFGIACGFLAGLGDLDIVMFLLIRLIDLRGTLLRSFWD